MFRAFVALFCCFAMSVATFGNNIVFVTSTTFQANFGGLAGGDAICQQRAAAAGLPGNYLAWLSTSTVNASNRLIHSISPYERVDGVLVASNWADLTDGSLANTISRTESNATLSAGLVWTATTGAGNYTGNSCADWTSNFLVITAGTGGLSNTSNSNWTNSGSTACSGTARIYCIQQVANPPGSISGTITEPDGRPIRHARIIISGGSLPSPITVFSGPHGTYTTGQLQSDTPYNLSIAQRRFTFNPQSRSVTIYGANVTGVNFTGTIIQ